MEASIVNLQESDLCFDSSHSSFFVSEDSCFAHQALHALILESYKESCSSYCVLNTLISKSFEDICLAAFLTSSVLYFFGRQLLGCLTLELLDLVVFGT